MSHKRPLVIFVALIVLAASSSAEEKPTAKDAKAKALAAVDRCRTEYTKAFNAADLKTMLSFYSKEADVFTASQQHLEGKAAIEKYLGGYLRAIKGAKGQQELTSRRLVAPNVCIEDGTFTMEGGALPRKVTGRYTIVLRKEAGEWKIFAVRSYAANPDRKAP